MANLDQSFNIVNTMNPRDEKNIIKAVEALQGVHDVKIDHQENRVLVSYTPGIANIQNIKEAIESQGVDVSDRGDD